MNICNNLALLLFANSQKGLVHFFRSQFLDKTFKGLYTPNGFDLALLIPYFVVMVILAGLRHSSVCAGLHVLQEPQEPHH